MPTRPLPGSTDDHETLLMVQRLLTVAELLVNPTSSNDSESAVEDSVTLPERSDPTEKLADPQDDV